MNPGANIRNRELAKIHIAKAQLGLDDETYRAMLWTCARVTSSKDLDFRGRMEVLKHLRSRGFVDGKPKRWSGRPHNADANAQLRKIEAQLTDRKLPWTYADAMAKRMFQVDKVAWCQPDQLQKIIAALTYQQKRIATKAGTAHAAN